MQNVKISFSFFILLIFSITSCDEPQQEIGNKKNKSEIQMNDGTLPDWAINANIYEVNIRQYTPEGTINAFSKHLTRLKSMGVKILWLMPVFPISSTKRKGPLGSYYAVSDFRSVNPEFGTKEDLRNLIEEIHKLDMKVIFDWVPNHTGWDHVWIKEHPEWYTHVGDTITHPYNLEGEPTDWYDVADLNYDSKELREEMQSCMEFWVKEYDIDGYRCDMAFFVPDDFWPGTISALNKIKPVFMLAEAEHPPIRKEGLFNMSYAWEFHHILNDIALGKKSAKDVREYLERTKNKFPAGFQMYFTSNHDENSWAGPAPKRMGAAFEVLSVLSMTMDGMPLIYSGQEAGNRKQLKFFEKDTIPWKRHNNSILFARLLKTKEKNKALWNGKFGGKLELLPTGKNDSVLAFTREKDGHRVVLLLNLSGKNQLVNINGEQFKDKPYFDFKKRKYFNFKEEQEFKLNPWSYNFWTNEGYDQESINNVNGGGGNSKKQQKKN